MARKTTYAPIRRIEDLIFLVRGQRVMLDSDLAKVYGVSTTRLNEQFRRNRERFPAAFAFQLTREELARLMSQNAISKQGRGGRRKLPLVFTEYGALQLANVLRSRTAIEASIRVIEVFVSMREQLAAHKELAGKLTELEDRIAGHDEAIQNLFEAIRQLVEPPLPESRRQIGFMRETALPYRLRTASRN
ncbi:MAG TPA: ORF6N domain-containing protein [Verrucomicrobiae bacterium]|nr:ORF6N domain-containing protein [Verrucomicrobiae bacterium]